jgi:hypothetical protein
MMKRIKQALRKLFNNKGNRLQLIYMDLKFEQKEEQAWLVAEVESWLILKCKKL